MSDWEDDLFDSDEATAVSQRTDDVGENGHNDEGEEGAVSLRPEDISVTASEEEEPLEDRIESIRAEWEEEKEHKNVFPLTVSSRDELDGYDFYIPPTQIPENRRTMAVGRILLGIIVVYFIVVLAIGLLHGL